MESLSLNRIGVGEYLLLYSLQRVDRQWRRCLSNNQGQYANSEVKMADFNSERRDG